MFMMPMGLETTIRLDCSLIFSYQSLSAWGVIGQPGVCHKNLSEKLWPRLVTRWTGNAREELAIQIPPPAKGRSFAAGLLGLPPGIWKCAGEL